MGRNLSVQVFYGVELTSYEEEHSFVLDGFTPKYSYETGIEIDEEDEAFQDGLGEFFSNFVRELGLKDRLEVVFGGYEYSTSYLAVKSSISKDYEPTVTFDPASSSITDDDVAALDAFFKHLRETRKWVLKDGVTANWTALGSFG